MNLTYRGASYQPSILDVPSVETGEERMFLGKTYKIKQPQLSFRQSTEELVYRGVRYTR